MPQNSDSILPTLDGWALVLGASSGFGEASCVEMARAGMNVVGVHFDRRETAGNASRIAGQIRALGREAWFFNVNAADPARRGEVLATVRARFAERARHEKVRVFLHSIAFGSLERFIGNRSEEMVSPKQLEMTSDVMAHSLVYWVQDLWQEGLFHRDGRIFALTSDGSRIAWGGYGAVSAAKASIESHVRQLARELAGTGITANCLCAGVASTPAARKIPSFSAMETSALARNPHGRLTQPKDVAAAIVALAQPGTYWMTGNVIFVDGGEGHCG